MEFKYVFAHLFPMHEWKYVQYTYIITSLIGLKPLPN